MEKAGSPYLLFLGEAQDELSIKGCTGVKIWRPEKARAQIRLEGCTQDLKLPDMTPAEAAEAGCKTMLLGVANAGGFIPDTWIGPITQALELGMDVMAGMHKRMADIPAIAEAAKRTGRKLFDVRQPAQEFKVGKGYKRAGKRVLTVGTDCSVGKMFTSLAIEKEMRTRGMNAHFRATGQSGIFIVGEGVAVDAVVADFISGATEWLCPENTADHWDVVEGQGSLFHPSFAGVSLGLLHGAQPDALVHVPRADPRRTCGACRTARCPSLEDCIEANERAARLTNPEARVHRHQHQHARPWREDEALAWMAETGRSPGHALLRSAARPASRRSSTSWRRCDDGARGRRPSRILAARPGLPHLARVQDRGRRHRRRDRGGRAARPRRVRALCALRRDRRVGLADIERGAGPRSPAGCGPPRAARPCCRPGAARNALDCALWDLEAKMPARRSGAWPGSTRPRTGRHRLHAEPRHAAEAMARARRRGTPTAPLLKVKLGGEAGRRAAARRCAPAAPHGPPHRRRQRRLDASSCCGRSAPSSRGLGVEMIEQPLPAGDDAALAGLACRRSPCAPTNRCHGSATWPARRPLRHGQHQARQDRRPDRGAGPARSRAARGASAIMVGCMVGTSLAMAPAMLLAEGAAVVDLDGPLLMKQDRDPGIAFDGNVMHPAPRELWG